MKGEIAYSLDAAHELLGEDADFTGMNFDLSAAYDDDKQLIILRSLVISETIVQKVVEESNKPAAILTLPSDDYVNDVSVEQTRDKWYNDYSGATVVKGEIARLLDACEYLLGGGTFENIAFDLSAAFNPLTQETILKSYVISETIVQQIYSETQSGNLSLPTTVYLEDPTAPERTTWYNSYVGETLIKGEIAYLLDAAHELLGEDADFTGMNFDLSAAYDDDKQLIILRSLVISETIVQKVVEESNKPAAILTLPSNDYVNDVSVEQTRDKWYNDYSGATVVKGEIARLLDACEHLLGGGTFENIAFDLSAAFNPLTQETILKSYVISETIVQQIYSETQSGNLSLPTTVYLEHPTAPERTTWYNSYVGETLIKGEIAYLLDAAHELLGEDADFAGMNFDLSAAYDDDKQLIILRSYVISETIVQKVVEESNKPAAILTLPSDDYVNDVSLQQTRDKWYNDYSGATVVKGEIARLLDSCEYLLGGGTFENISFDLSAAFNPLTQEAILKSYVISETIVQQIYSETQSGNLSLPTTVYLEHPTAPERTTWYNSYVGETLVKGEIAYLLDAANELLGEGASFTGMNFDLSAAYDDDKQLVILRSFVISETIVQKVVEESNKPGAILTLPSDDYVNDVSLQQTRDKWYNDYSGATVVKGEIARLLESCEHLLNGGTFENISFDLSAAFNPLTQETILKSYVISETIVQQIYSETQSGNLSLPTTVYLEHPTAPERTTWYNSYVGETLVKGEIAYLLDAANELLGEGASFTGMNFDLSAAYDDDKQLVILRSFVISETIVQKVVDESNKPGAILTIPSTTYVNNILTDNSRDKWFSDYSGATVVKGEIARLLESCEYLLGGGTFENIAFDLSAAFDPLTQETILKSHVISETIVQIVIDESTAGTIKIPSTTYVNATADPSRDKWFNSYVGETLVKGEIAYLLDAADQILPDGADFSGINFNLETLFDANSQKIVLKSTVFSETIISKIVDQDGNAVNVPVNDLEGNSLSDTSDRTPWFNQYVDDEVNRYGEIAKMLNATNAILGGSGTFETMSFDINVLFDDTKQGIVLKSLVLSETIVQKIFANTTAISDIPNVDLRNRALKDATDRIAWFNEYDNSDDLLAENELAKFLDAIALILNGNDFASMGAITIDSILDLTFVITLDVNMDVVSSEFATLVDSVVMENIVSPLVQTVATTVMDDYLIVPSGGYNWFKKDLITGFDPSTMDASIYDTESFLESLYTMHKSGIDYTNLGATPVSSLDDPTIVELSKAMVISRTFKGSTAFMYNTILEPTYNAMPASIPGVATKKSWDDVKFIQADYDGTKVESYNNLVAKFAELKQTQTVTFMGMDYDVSTAFYNID
ncbi:MAG: hypothetical protein PHP41_03085 [Bacilli bacterium]|nr:hypothetical protein [Bacilli bacterium]